MTARSTHVVDRGQPTLRARDDVVSLGRDPRAAPPTDLAHVAVTLQHEPLDDRVRVAEATLVPAHSVMVTTGLRSTVLRAARTGLSVQTATNTAPLTGSPGHGLHRDQDGRLGHGGLQVVPETMDRVHGRGDPGKAPDARTSGPNVDDTIVASIIAAHPPPPGRSAGATAGGAPSITAAAVSVLAPTGVCDTIWATVAGE